ENARRINPAQESRREDRKVSVVREALVRRRFGFKEAPGECFMIAPVLDRPRSLRLAPKCFDDGAVVHVENVGEDASCEPLDRQCRARCWLSKHLGRSQRRTPEDEEMCLRVGPDIKASEFAAEILLVAGPQGWGRRRRTAHFSHDSMYLPSAGGQADSRPV